MERVNELASNYKVECELMREQVEELSNSLYMMEREYNALMSKHTLLQSQYRNEVRLM